MTEDTEEMPMRDPDEYCNARKTDGDGYCKHEAGWGTDHPGRGRCKFHGGSTPNQEKGIIAELEEAAEDASMALRLQIKHVLEDAKDPDTEVDTQDLVRLAREILDRTPTAPNRAEDVNQTVEGDAFEAVTVSFADTDDETDED